MPMRPCACQLNQGRGGGMPHHAGQAACGLIAGATHGVGLLLVHHIVHGEPNHYAFTAGSGPIPARNVADRGIRTHIHGSSQANGGRFQQLCNLVSR